MSLRQIEKRRWLTRKKFKESLFQAGSAPHDFFHWEELEWSPHGAYVRRVKGVTVEMLLAKAAQQRLAGAADPMAGYDEYVRDQVIAVEEDGDIW